MKPGVTRIKLMIGNLYAGQGAVVNVVAETQTHYWFMTHEGLRGIAKIGRNKTYKIIEER